MMDRFFALVLLSLSAFWMTPLYGAMLEKGVMDAAAWDPDQQSRLKLQGEWRFYPDRFVNAEDMTNLESLPHMLIKMPGQSWEEAGYRNQGHGTLAVRLEHLPAGRLGLLIDQFFNNYRSFFAYTDGDGAWRVQPLMSVGKVGTDRDSSIPQSRKKVTSLPAVKDGWLLIHVSEYTIDATYRSTPSLGRFPAIFRDEITHTRWESFFVLGAFFMLLVSNLALFLQRRDDRGSLHMAAFALVMGVRFTSTEGLWGEAFTAPNTFVWLFGVFNILMDLPLGLLCIMLFLHHSFPKYIVPWMVRSNQVFVAGCVALAVFSFPSVPQVLMILVNGIFLVVPPLLMVQTIRAAWKGQRGAGLSALGLGLMIIAMLNDILVAVNNAYDAPYLGQYGMLAFIITQSQVVGKNFAHAFRTAERLSRDLRVEVERQTRDAKTILHSVQQGLMTINADGAINDDYSRFVTQILGDKAPERQNIRKIFLDRSDLTREAKDMTMTILETSVGEDAMNFETNAGNLPNTLRFEGGRILELDWQPVVNEKTDLVEKILLAIKDVTALKALEAKNQKTQREIDIITRLLEISTERFMLFYKSSRELLEESRRLAGQTSGHNEETLRLLFVNMHTIKGAARTYHFSEITNSAHECEQYYADVQKGIMSWDRQKALALLSDVEAPVDEYFAINRYKLKREPEENMARIDLKLVRDHILELQKLKRMDLDADLMPFVTRVKDTFFNIYFSDARTFFEDMTSKLPSLARDLGKEPPEVVIRGAHVGFTVDGAEILRKTFVHLLRNAVDHGLEPADVRVAKGKKPSGTIFIDLREHPDGYLEIDLSDDGAGLRLDRIHDKAKGMKLFHADHKPSIEEIANFIFVPGFSTASSVSEISGRGVGMDAVRKVLADAGGQIFIQLLEQPQAIKPVAFAFRIFLPHEHWAELNAAPPSSGSESAA
ncbi:MAG TPA: 7TM diverse intracellular signaling domain-containing protein [Oligoflexus sp.]|uniref:7TM diverse intracellular signaling domain-containing protein n=1 Tax=Oligoflexus sp. TaxID=1971216 RepID=UPI002D80FC1A|nr:7TM diverse intracellular signaling domain-containing protein [Oligoflexus sp.]HET9239834.1 7TM diverse intracellular signaling domain-containing protein [Oligoflexus sp.]